MILKNEEEWEKYGEKLSSQSQDGPQFVMIFLKRLLWSAFTNLFAAWIMIDMMLWQDFENVQTHQYNGSTYDFIVGKKYAVRWRHSETSPF